ncbi:MAG: DinB family protein [Cyclobacteriaceae bacterium]
MILQSFLNDMDRARLKTRRKADKWSIHENACHLAQAEIMINARFLKFKSEPAPIFEPYLPGNTIDDNELIRLDLYEQLNAFKKLREDTKEILSGFDASTWQREGSHPQYHTYNPRILLRHTLMHDHFHMYRIEELWLTKVEYL